MKKFVPEYTPEFCYSLGFLWGDGNIVYRPSRYEYKVQFEIVKEDFQEVFPVFQAWEKWHSYERNRKNRRTSSVAAVCGKHMCEYLIEYNYKNKGSEATILNAIPKEMQHYWLRGLLDADGHISFKNQSTGNGKYKHLGVHFYACYNYQWSSILNVLKQFNFKCRQRKRVTGNTSEISCQTRESALLFLDLIYSGKQFGLSRKKEKYTNACLFYNHPAGPN